MYVRRSKTVKIAAILLLIVGCFVVFELIPSNSYDHETELHSPRSHGDLPVATSNEISITELLGKTSSSQQVSSEERLHAVNQVCKDSPKTWLSLSASEQKILSRHIIVNDEHKVMYCYVPKVACANWKRVIMVLDGKVVDSNAVIKVNHNEFTFLQDLPPQEAQRKLKEYHKFMFVRDPIARLWSAFKDKFMLNHTGALTFQARYGKEIVKSVRKNAPKNPTGNVVSFTEFLQYVEQTNYVNMNEHWMPYHTLCQPCAVLYDFIGSFENLQTDAAKVLKQLKVDEQVSFPKQQPYYKKGGAGYASTENTQVTASILKRVLHKKYSTDYEMFSFHLPDF